MSLSKPLPEDFDGTYDTETIFKIEKELRSEFKRIEGSYSQWTDRGRKWLARDDVRNAQKVRLRLRLEALDRKRAKEKAVKMVTLLIAETKEIKETKETKDIKETKETKETKEAKETKETKTKPPSIYMKKPIPEDKEQVKRDIETKFPDCVKACEAAYTSADLFDPKIQWEFLGDAAMSKREHLHAVRCYTRALRCITVEQHRKFKKVTKGQSFDAGPYAKVRYKLAHAFMAVSCPGLALDEIGFAEQYIGDFYYMCKVLEALGWSEMLKKRRENLLDSSFVSGDDAATKHNWLASDAVKAKLEYDAAAVEGREFNVNISNLRREGTDTVEAFPHLEVRPYIFKMVGSQSQIPMRFPEDFSSLFERIHKKHPNITLFASPKHRVGMRAERDFKRGEKIFSEEALLSLAVQPENCGICLKVVETKEQRICTRCNGKNCEIYCSMECRNIADEKYHRKICGANLEKLYHVSRISPQDFGFYQIMLLKAIGITLQNPNWPKVCVFDMPQFKYLWGRAGMEVDIKKMFPTYHWVARWSATYGLPNFNFDVYQALVCMLASNCLKSTQNGRVTGIVLGDAMCYMNHDCSPNSGIRVDRDLIGVYAMTDIKKGQEITYSYIPRSSPRQGRKEMLFQWDIRCNCKLCIG